MQVTFDEYQHNGRLKRANKFPNPVLVWTVCAQAETDMYLVANLANWDVVILCFSSAVNTGASGTFARSQLFVLAKCRCRHTAALDMITTKAIFDTLIT
ncbi:hypothetical protein NQZ79_g1408 [Umbelopsis isabellina]|nr:hypothetical protein NQZ79_g1408 [Umbelopsis isabellina]